MATTTTSTQLTTDDAPGRFVRINGCDDIHVVVDGDLDSDVVVACVHGVPGSARDFTALGRALRERGACCVRFDMPGFGRTLLTNSPRFSPSQRAEIVTAAMQKLGVRRFVVVGHSFGGSVALSAAGMSTSSPAVSALVMVCAVGITRHRGLSIPHELTGLVAPLRDVPVVGARLSAPVVGFVRGTIAKLGVRGERPYSDDEIVAHTQVIGGLDFVALRHAAATVSVPALVVSARDDRLVEPATSFALVEALSSSSSPLVSHRHMATGGHFLQRRAADPIAAWITSAVGSTSTTPAAYGPAL
ncbi:MAG TPA: alpha/beta hydrolase [Myxococcota bacterium]